MLGLGRPVACVLDWIALVLVGTPTEKTRADADFWARSNRCIRVLAQRDLDETTFGTCDLFCRRCHLASRLRICSAHVDRKTRAQPAATVIKTPADSAATVLQKQQGLQNWQRGGDTGSGCDLAHQRPNQATANVLEGFRDHWVLNDIR